MVQLLKFSLALIMIGLILGMVLPIGMVLPVAFAQEAKLEMTFVGYGKNYQELYISFKNTGDITISDVTIYIDDKAYKTIEGASGPGTVFEEVLFLEEGEHLIEARTPEGAYDSLEVTAAKGEIATTSTTITATTTLPEKPEMIGKNILWIVLGVAILVFGVSLWFVRKEKSVKRKKSARKE